MIANARMYTINETVAAAWRQLFEWIAHEADVPLDVVARVAATTRTRARQTPSHRGNDAADANPARRLRSAHRRRTKTATRGRICAGRKRRRAGAGSRRAAPCALRSAGDRELSSADR